MGFLVGQHGIVGGLELAVMQVWVRERVPMMQPLDKGRWLSGKVRRSLSHVARLLGFAGPDVFFPFLFLLPRPCGVLFRGPEPDVGSRYSVTHALADPDMTGMAWLGSSKSGPLQDNHLE